MTSGHVRGHRCILLINGRRFHAARRVASLWSAVQAVLTRQAAAQELPKCGAGEPVIAQRFDIRHGGPNLLLSCPQELKDAQLHGVILQLGLTDDALKQRQENVLV